MMDSVGVSILYFDSTGSFMFTELLNCSVEDSRVRIPCISIFPLPCPSLKFLFPSLLSLSAVQERLTREIAEAILKAIKPTGVGVVVEAT